MSMLTCPIDTQSWAAMPRRARDALKKADPQLVDALEHRMLTALAEAAVNDARRDPDTDEVPTKRTPPDLQMHIGVADATR